MTIFVFFKVTGDYMGNSKTSLLFLSLLFFTFPIFTQEITSSYFKLDVTDWTIIDTSKTKYTPESILNECDNYYREIYENLFGRIPEVTGDKKLLRIVDYQNEFSTNHVSGKCLYITNSTINNNKPPLAHEITHLIIYDPNLISYSEGLADYFQNRFTPDDKQFILYKGNCHRKLKVFWTYYYSDTNALNIINGKLNSGFYLEAESLVNYLIYKYGVQEFLEYFYGGGYKSYNGIFSISKEDLKKEWVEYVLKQEPDSVWIQNWDKINSLYKQ